MHEFFTAFDSVIEKATARPIANGSSARSPTVPLDPRLPRQNGIETIQQLREAFGAVRVLVFSNYASGDEIFQAFKAGACGCVAKEMTLDKLLEAIRCVYSGNQYPPMEIAQRLNGRVLSQLSPRESEVLSLVAKGMSNKEIGAALDVIEGTVKVHLKNILAKLNVNDRTQAILVAVKRGIIRLD